MLFSYDALRLAGRSHLGVALQAGFRRADIAYI
jgi:hypothetical protein